MKKSFFFAMVLAASTLAFVACNDKKDKEVSEDQEQKGQQDLYPASEYDGFWVSDSVLNGNDAMTHDVLMWEIINSKQILFHGQDTATWEIYKDHFFKFTFKDGYVMEAEGMTMDLEHNWFSIQFMSEKWEERVGAYDGGLTFYMYHLQKPQGDKLPVTQANLLGKWRYGYEENKMYEDGKCVSVTRFNHVGLEILDLQPSGKMVLISPPYTYDRTWELNGETIKLLSSDAYGIVELYKNYMHIAKRSIDGTSGNEQYYWRLD